MSSGTKIKQSGVVLVMMLVLSACVLEEDEDCLAENRAGRPDMTSTPVSSAANVNPGGTINVQIPIDADTAGGTLFLVPVSSQNPGDSVDMNNDGEAFVQANVGNAETVTVPVTVDGAAAAGSYYPLVVLCDGTCAVGTAYVSDLTGFLADGNYLRANADGGSTMVDLGSLSNSCISQPTITVN